MDVPIRSAIDCLKTQNGNSRAVQESTVFLLNTCHNTEPKFREKQTRAAELGAVEALISVALSEAPELTQILCFRALGVMTFSNKYVSGMIGQSNRFIHRVEDILRSTSLSDTFKEEALYPMKNAAGEVWSIHPNLYCLVEPVVDVVNKLHDPSLRTKFTPFLCVMSYNPSCRSALISAGCVTPLLELLLNSPSEGSFPLSAAITLACLLGDEVNHPALDLVGSDAVVAHMMSALKAAVRGEDYPTGSGTYFVHWKIMMGIQLLCNDKTRRQRFRKGELLGVMETALALTAQQDQENLNLLRRHTLAALWQLSVDDT